MPTAEKPRVFISYARRDGESWAHRIRSDLTKAGVDVWLDTTRIGGGASWSKEIEDGLAQCDVVVAVLTPGAFLSEMCRSEQIAALEQGKSVIPVIPLNSVPIPIYLKSRMWRRYPEQLADLLADLDAPRSLAYEDVRAPIVYDTVPNLPQNHLPRPDAVAKLRDMVFTEGDGANIAVTAVAGMGGIGKTVLVTALCRDPVVRRAFPDGIAWITVGRESRLDIVERMREVARALGDNDALRDGQYEGELACRNRYQTILRDKAALVVIDDVWDLADLDPLLVEAPRSRFVFTTRDSSLADAKAAREYQADLLTEGEARHLLARWVDLPEEALPTEAERIIVECGRLALAIGVMGGSLRGAGPEEWRDALELLERADISAIEERLPTGQRSFFRSLDASLQSVSPVIRERYLELAVLVEDFPMPNEVLRAIWNVSASDVRRTARYLANRSLAYWEGREGEEHETLRLHDLPLDYLRAKYPHQAALPLIHGAFRLASDVIRRDPLQFSSQMVGRLLSNTEVPGVGPFVAAIAAGAPGTWLRPLNPALLPPGTGLVRILQAPKVTHVAVSPDGRRAISASKDGGLSVWEVETGRELRTLAGHTAAVTGLAMSSNGRRLISVSSDQTLRVWDPETGRQLLALPHRTGAVSNVAITSDGHRAVSINAGRNAKVWDLKVWDLEGQRELLNVSCEYVDDAALALSSNGRTVVIGAPGSALRVLDLETGHELHMLRGHSAAVTAVAVSGNGQLAVSASADHTLILWDLEAGREVRKLQGHSNIVNAVAMTQDGRTAISASDDRTLKVWDLESGRELRTLEGHANRVIGVALSDDGRRAVSIAWDETRRIWNLEAEPAARMLTGHSDKLTGVAVREDGGLLVTASDDKTLKIWDLTTWRELHILEGHTLEVTSVAISPDGKLVVSGSFDDSLGVWNVESGSEIHTLRGHEWWINGVAVTRDGRRAVSGSRDKTLKIWDLESGCELRTLQGHSDEVNAVAITPDGDRAVSASADRTVRVWELNTGRALHTFEGHSGAVTTVAVTQDGQRAISGSSDGTIRVWNLHTMRHERTINGLAYQVAVSSEARWVVSTSPGHTLVLWDLETGKRLATYTCDGPATCCAFVGGRKLVAGDYGGRVHLLQIETTPSR